MSQPFALRETQVRKGCLKRGILRGAGIDAEADLLSSLPHVADAHLLEVDAVIRAFDAVVGFPAAEAVPHGFDGRGNVRSGPVGIAVVCHHAAQALVFFIFIFDGSLQPVFRIQIQDDSALVETALAGKFGFHNEGKELLAGRHL